MWMESVTRNLWGLELSNYLLEGCFNTHAWRVAGFLAGIEMDGIPSSHTASVGIYWKIIYTGWLVMIWY